MAKKQTKTEVIHSDDPDIDCFGNFSNKEKICTVECGLSSQCSMVTKSLADDKNKLYQIKTAFDDDINNSKKILKDNKSVVDLKKKLEEKHKEVKKQMSKESDKKVIKKKVKEDKSEIKNIVKAPKKASDSSGGEKKAAKKPKKSSFETVHNSVVPTAFESLYKFAKKIEGAELVKKASVTNVKLANGIAFCFTKTGTTDSKLSIYVNRSAGYKGFGTSSEVDIVKHPKGDFIFNVKNSDKSRSEAIKLLSKWVKEREAFISGQKSSGKAKKSKDSEKSSKDKTKKASGKPEKASDDAKPAKAKKAKDAGVKTPKETSGKKKETPDVKPSKKAKFEDEEG